MINVNSLLAYYKSNSNYVVKLVKGTDYNIEYLKSKNSRKNVLVELYPKTGRFYLNKNGEWINIRELQEIRSDADVIAWVEKDSENLSKGI